MDALSPGALHISCSTISVALSERLTAEHAARAAFVAAPVFGRPNIAEEGRCGSSWPGHTSAVTTRVPLLEPLSRGISVVGAEPARPMHSSWAATSSSAP